MRILDKLLRKEETQARENRERKTLERIIEAEVIMTSAKEIAAAYNYSIVPAERRRKTD